MLPVKNIMLSALALTVIFVNVASAQKNTIDTAITIKRAQKFARSFRLDEDLQPKFIASNFPATSDYFKPTSENVSDPLMLSDSVFVKAYKAAALASTIKMIKKQDGKPAGAFEAPNVSPYALTTARADAKGFIVPPEGMADFKHDKLTPTSDYFKPTSFYAANTVSLKDSDYNKAFRYEAFTIATKKKHHSGGNIGLILLGIAAGGIGLYYGLLNIFGAR